MVGLYGKSNPSFDWYQKNRKPRNQNQYQKHQSRSAEVQFQGVKIGFFKNRQLQQKPSASPGKFTFIF
jgi:hypothetical protein